MSATADYQPTAGEEYIIIGSNMISISSGPNVDANLAAYDGTNLSQALLDTLGDNVPIGLSAIGIGSDSTSSNVTVHLSYSKIPVTNANYVRLTLTRTGGSAAATGEIWLFLIQTK